MVKFFSHLLIQMKRSRVEKPNLYRPHSQPLSKGEGSPERIICNKIYLFLSLLYVIINLTFNRHPSKASPSPLERAGVK